MANIIKLHQKAAAAPGPVATNAFERFGLTSNPFPSVPLFSSATDDPRRNGTIYDTRYREEEEREFLQKFLLPAGGGRPPSLGFIQMRASTSVRGGGKSAFLHHVMRRVNARDWGAKAPDPDSPDLLALAVHVQPHPRVDRTFADLVRLIFLTMEAQHLFAVVDGQVRAAVFVDLAPAPVLAELSEFDGAELDALFESEASFQELLGRQKITPRSYLDALTEKLSERGRVKDPDRNPFLREYLREGGGGGSLARLWTAWGRVRVGDSPRLRKDLVGWLLDGLVPILLAGGYRRMLLLVDEFEKIFLYQTDRMREELLDTLRGSFLEGDSVAARAQFVTTVLTFHSNIERELAKHWERVGLSGIAPLHDDVRSRTIELPAPSRDRLIGLLVTYLDHFRVGGERRGSWHPFAPDAMIELVERAGLSPRNALRLAYDVMQAAAREAFHAPIPLEFVERTIRQSVPHLREQYDDLDSLPELDLGPGPGDAKE